MFSSFLIILVFSMTFEICDSIVVVDADDDNITMSLEGPGYRR
jgi:hypothetical protein